MNAQKTDEKNDLLANLQFYPGNVPTNKFITIDSQGRMYISKAAKSIFSQSENEGASIKLYAAYDKENGRIALSEDESLEQKGIGKLSFDGKNGYASAKRFKNRFNIHTDKKPKFIYVAEQAGWMFFEVEDKRTLEPK